jgi:hypothetical protein
VVPKDGLGLPAPSPPETRALAALALYQPRFVWPPDFRGTHEWRVLREDIAEHGIRTPLRILRNGWVIDGTHRCLIAQELGLEQIPVQVVPLSLGRPPGEVLSALDRLRIERMAVREAIGRRHLTRHQVDVLFLTLAEARAAVFGDVASRLARSRANLRVGNRSESPPEGPTIEELARQYRTHPWRIRQLLALAERGDSGTREQFKTGRLPLRRAYETTRSPLPQPLGTVLAQCLDSRGHVTEPAGLDVRVGVLDVGFRTTDYFTLDGLAVLPARCLTRNTGMADLLLDLSREVYRRWGVPHALDEATLRGVLRIGGTEVRLGPVLDPWLTGAPRPSQPTGGCSGVIRPAGSGASGSRAAAARCWVLA